jgi:hypothetical protein
MTVNDPKGVKEEKRREPKGSENWPTLDKSCGIKDRPPKGEEGHVPCYWSNHGHKELTPSNINGSTAKYREAYDDIEWD